MDEVKTPLGMEVDLGPGRIVLDVYPFPRKRGTAAPSSFRPVSVVAMVARALVKGNCCYCFLKTSCYKFCSVGSTASVNHHSVGTNLQ